MAMKIAITRLKGKDEKDKEYCARYGHDCFIVSPLTAKVHDDRVASFVKAVEREDFDCIFFTSALPAQIIAPLITRRPRVIAIGPQTARILKSHGIDCETLPTYYSRDFVPYLGIGLKVKELVFQGLMYQIPTSLRRFQRPGDCHRDQVLLACAYGADPRP